MPPGAASDSPGSSKNSFITALFRILKDGRPEIYWSRNGRCVVIEDGPQLVENVCKIDFNQNTASSFYKQLSNWRFESMRYKQKTRAGAASADYPTEQLPSSARVWRHPQITRDSNEAEVAAIKRKPDGASKKSSLASARKGKRVARERFGGKRSASKEADEEQGEDEEDERQEGGEEEGYDAGMEGDSEMRRIEESDEELEEEESEQPIASTSAAVSPPPISRSHQPQSRDLQSHVAPTSSPSIYSVPFTSPYVYGRPPTAPPMAPPRLPPATTQFTRIQAQEPGKLQASHTSGLFNLVAISSGSSAPSVNTPQMPYPPISALATAAPAAPGPLARSFENPTLLPPQNTESSSFPLLKRRLHTLRPTDPSNSTSANPPQSEIYYYSSSANSNDSQGSVGRGIGFDNVWVLDTQEESQESSAQGSWRERHPYVTKGSQSSQSWPKLNRGASELFPEITSWSQTSAVSNPEKASSTKPQ